MTTAIAPVSVATAAKVLRSLLAGRTRIFIAGDCQLNRQTVDDIAYRYGFGVEDLPVLDRRLDQLTAEVTAGRGDVLIDFDAGLEDDVRPTSLTLTATPLTQKPSAAPDTAAVSALADPLADAELRVDEPSTVAEGDSGSVAALLARAASSPVQRTVTLGERIKREIADLTVRLDAESASAAARSEIARLEAALRAARAGLPKQTPAARDQACTVPGCSPGRVFSAPGLARHRTRLHGGAA